MAITEDCIRCDGCGWHEGGETIQTRCESCGGSGQVARPPSVLKPQGAGLNQVVEQLRVENALLRAALTAGIPPKELV